MGDAAIEDLIARMNSDNTTIAQEAQYSLESLGPRAVAPVLRAVSRLGVFGQRCALDLLTSWPSTLVRDALDPSVEEAVVPLLSSEDGVVRIWAAEALGHAEARGAVPSLRQALERAKRSRVALDDSEPVALRQALTLLGDRRQVTPALLHGLEERVDRLGSCWPAGRLAALIAALAEERQVLLYCQAWQRRAGRFYRVDGPSFDVDFLGQWPEIVARARVAATQAVKSWIAPPSTFVTLEWIGESDR